MSTEEILEGNELIAQFMESDSLPMQYDYSWNWLIPVVVKIEQIELSGQMYTVSIRDSHCEIIEYAPRGKGVFLGRESNSKISSVWQAVVAFINWYNTQKL